MAVKSGPSPVYGLLARARLVRAAMYHPPSPCTGVCRLETPHPAGQERCVGCLRTLDEIADWPMMRPSEKAELLALLARRS
ncbi:MAG: DUF1289 domain-containing protein [Novosphingobium sp.]